MAIQEASSPQPAEVTPTSVSESAAAGPKNSEAAVVWGLLASVRQQLKELRADDVDSEKRAHLVADEASLERILGALLSK